MICMSFSHFLVWQREYAASCFTQSMMLQQGIPTATLCDYNNVLTVFLLSNLTPDPVYYGDFQCIDKEKKVVKVVVMVPVRPPWPGRTKPDLHIMDYLQKVQQEACP